MQDSKEILAVGSIAFDSIKTPNGNRDKILGGSCTYFSVAASHYAQVSIIGVVGDDFQNQEKTEQKKQLKFSEKIDELNQETDNLLDEIDKWQT